MNRQLTGIVGAVRQAIIDFACRFLGMLGKGIFPQDRYQLKTQLSCSISNILSSFISSLLVASESLAIATDTLQPLKTLQRELSRVSEAIASAIIRDSKSVETLKKA